MIGEALRLIRTFYDMKQTEASELLSISKSYISEIEKGTKSPSIDIIDRYSKVFGIPSSSILFFSESLDKNENNSSRRLARQVVSSKILTLLQFIEARRRPDAEDD